MNSATTSWFELRATKRTEYYFYCWEGESVSSNSLPPSTTRASFCFFNLRRLVMILTITPTEVYTCLLHLRPAGGPLSNMCWNNIYHSLCLVLHHTILLSREQRLPPLNWVLLPAVPTPYHYHPTVVVWYEWFFHFAKSKILCIKTTLLIGLPLIAISKVLRTHYLITPYLTHIRTCPHVFQMIILTASYSAKKGWKLKCCE